MSLTNPNTPVSQQDLQDFYHKLLPYMGNSFAMIANKFSKGDLYSTDEKMIGQWVDGKPLYQKVYTGQCPTTTGNVSVEVDSDFSGKEYKFSRGNITVPSTGNILDCNNGDGVLTYSKHENNVDKIVIYLPSNKGYSQAYYKIAVVYTKTTDSAISIGSDTDYSTEEKIVGTWIDGRPIWQKTVSGTMPASGSDTKISVSSDIVDFVLTCKGVVPEYRTQPMSDYISVGNSTLMMAFFDTEEQKVYLRNNNVPAVQGKTAYVTITYVKTTTD